MFETTDVTIQNKIAYVYFLKSPCFQEHSYKLIISKVASEDIISAHKDIYCAAEQGTIPKFIIDEVRIVRDKDLFLSSLQKIKKIRDGFFADSTKSTIVQIINAVNSLTIIYDPDDVDPGKYQELVVSEDVACFDTTKAPNPNESDEQFIEVDFNHNVPVTRMFEICDRECPDNKLQTYCTSIWTPLYNQFFVFKNGYGYILDEFQRIFPEFIITAHDNFPKISLAEDMLWFTAAGTNVVDVKQIVEKIRVFFDCSIENNKNNSNPDKSVDSKDSPKPSSSVLDPPKPINEMTFHTIFEVEKTPIATFPPEPVFTQQTPQPIPQSSKIYTPTNVTLASNENPIPPLSMDMTTISENQQYASPFHIKPSPCKDAFTSKEGPWGKDTRKEITDVTIHSEKRIMLREFIDQKCHKFIGAKVKSSRLLEVFRDYYLSKKFPVPFEKAYNQTSFTMLMKQLSTFDTKREKDGMYWIDLHIGDCPPYIEESKIPLCTNQSSITFTNEPMEQFFTVAASETFNTNDEREQSPNAMTFAEFFSKKNI
jgi:hypothetical protein